MILENNLIELINQETHTLIIENQEGVLLTDNRFGVMCLIENFDKDFGPVNIYDKLIGKGAALLMTKHKLVNVYAKTITTEAIEILSPICNLSYSREVENILNRDRSDLCPIEKIAKDISDVQVLYQALKAFYVERGYLND